VLSLWRVGDAATAHLMQAFYDALRGEAPGVKGPLDVAAALRYAQLATRAAVSAHPSAWGPWLVVGDGGWRLP
jgi:CHAT domain-containing protein